MKRREFLLFAAAAAAFPRGGLAQPPRIPLLVVLSGILSSAFQQAIASGLADHGYVPGGNIAVEYLAAPTNAEMQTYAAEAVARQPDVILAVGAPATRAVRDITTAMPIVFTNLVDPVATGLVSNLARPGGNLTGNTILGAPLAAKALAILRELLPKVSRIALFETSAIGPEAAVLRGLLREGANALAIDVVVIDVKNLGEDFAPYFDQARASGAQAIFVAGYLAAGVRSGPALYELSLHGRWPTFATTAGNLDKGGLFSYGVSNEAVIRRSLYHVDQILKGANPATLPVELPATVDLVINLKAARALGITIPPAVLFQATQLIE
jgi:putative ABC transport system substrate-binding protein